MKRCLLLSITLHIYKIKKKGYFIHTYVYNINIYLKKDRFLSSSLKSKKLHKYIKIKKKWHLIISLIIKWIKVINLV